VDQIDLLKLTNDLQSRIIINVSVGAGSSEREVRFEDENGAIGLTSISEAITRQFEWLSTRFGQPFNFIFPELLDWCVHPKDRRMRRNANHLKDVLREIIADRRAGRSRIYGDGHTDLLNILLESEFYKRNEACLVDELITFFVAGMKTVQHSTANLICYMDHNREIKKRLLDEIVPVVEAAKDDIVANLKYETVMDLDYLHLCYYESLRIDAPTLITAAQSFNRDVTLKNGLEVKKEDTFYVLLHAVHHDPEQWQRPSEYLPDRFDPKSPLYAKPNGDPRHALAFTPFMGGKRQCIGKTFSEVVIRYTVPILYYHFDFELVLPEHKIKKPKIHMSARVAPVVPIKLTHKVRA
jgi:cytochrome P450